MRQDMVPLLHLSRTIPLIFLSFLLLKLVSPNPNVAYVYHFCLDKGNYTQNSTFQDNLNILLPNLSSEASLTGFYNSTAGEGIDKVYALFLCRGDVTPQVCHDCVDSATQIIVQKCPKQKEAIIWYEECMLRYSNRSIFSIEEEYPWSYWHSSSNVSINQQQFSQLLSDTLDGLFTEAAFNSLAPTFSTGEANITVFQKLYCLVQCTPDITGYECNRCLRVAIGEYQDCCAGSQWAMVFQPSCQLRYDMAPFYEVKSPPQVSTPQLPPSPPANVTNNGGKGKSTSYIPVVVAVPVVAAVLLISGIWYYLHRRKPKEEPSDVDEIGSVESLQFDFNAIKAATENFSSANKLGEGGFGVVYKGRLQNGQLIAVKRLSRNSGQGAEEFKNEVLLVAKLQHRNLVKLLGFSLEGDEKLLVYEFVANTSLDRFLFDPNKRAYLDWGTRYKIIVGIARGLLYLHEDSRLKIIHRDLKSSNILLDEEMNSKISDFGMAKLFGVDQTQGNTSRIVGTHGYMAPEYAMTGQFSVKSDVFSFGVILLEIVSGQKNSCFYQSERIEDLLRYAWKLWNEGATIELMDSTLNKDFSRNEVIRCIHVGLLCVQEDAANRPTMASVVLMLNSYSMTLEFPSAPAFFSYSIEMSKIDYNLQTREHENRASESDKSTGKSNNWYLEKEQVTDLYPR